MKSRMKGDFHVRFRENAKVKFLCVTRHGLLKEERINNVKIKSMKKIALIIALIAISFINAFSQSVDLKNGLVAHYPFNGNANDESGNGNNGNVKGVTLTSDRNGKSNSAYYFNGYDNYITASFQNVYSIAISFWFRAPIQSNDYSVFVDCNRLSLYCQILGPTYKSTGNYGKLFFLANKKNMYSYSTYNDDKWYHMYIDYDNNTGQQKMYINGLLINKNSISNSINLNKIYIGRQEDYLASTFFKGYIDDIYIFNRSLNENEIQALYTGQTEETINPPIITWENPNYYNSNTEQGNYKIKACVKSKKQL